MNIQNEQFLWFLAGAVAGFFINLLSTALYPLFQRLYRRLLRKISKKALPPLPTPEMLSIGGVIIDWIVLARAHYTAGRIQCFYDDRPVPLIPHFARLLKDRVREYNERLKKGASDVPYNSPTYKLKEFDVGYREIIDGEEVPVLRLTFGPTDYYTQTVTDFNVSDPIRQRYAQANDITIRPIPEFASILGIGINLITADDYLIVTERSTRSFVGSGKLAPSVGENLLRPTDAAANGAPDPFRCALRGVQEEIGVVLDYQSVEYTAFGVHPELCQYSLIGTARLKQTREEIITIRALAIPKDKWESRHLFFVHFAPDDVARYVVSTLDRWHTWGLAAAVLSLLHEGYSEKRLNEAFMRARFKKNDGKP